MLQTTVLYFLKILFIPWELSLAFVAFDLRIGMAFGYFIMTLVAFGMVLCYFSIKLSFDMVRLYYFF